jgi:stage III sporulation protein AA
LFKEVDKMNRKSREQQVLQVLAKPVRTVVESEGLDFEKVQEIRMRIGKPLCLVYNNEEKILTEDTKKEHLVTKEEMRETLEYVSHYSLYAYEQEMKQGFITIEGGHRVGMMGKAILEGNKVKNLQYISSVNIRMSHEILGCADRILPFITTNRQVCHTLVISPPRCGKTTLIRDLIRQISDGNLYVKGCTVGVVDERSEIGGCYLGVAQNQLGMRTDVLDGCPKGEGMIMLIRSMAPQVIAVDEIGAAEDIHAIEYAMQCGCKMIASVHGMSMDEAADKPVLGRLIKERKFERYIILDNQKKPGEIKAIYNERGSLLCSDL